MSLMEKETMEMVKEAQRQYQREWRKKNPDKVKAISNRYWTKKAMQMKEGANREEKEA